MKHLDRWLVGLLVAIGTLVGLMSLYMASLTGIMSKMGLVGGDFRQSVKQNELARQLRGQDETVNCGVWQVAQQVPRYFFSRGETRVRLAGELGEVRVICGIRLVQNGNVERGVYTLMKGLYYLKSHYGAMKVLVQQDRSACELLATTAYERWVQAYLLSTEGRLYDIVLQVYKQVETERAGVAELCLD